MGLQNKRSVADAEKLLSEHFQSGQSRKEFCQVRGINVGTFQCWMKRHNDAIKTTKKPEPSKAPFVQITPRIQPVCTTPDESEIVIDLRLETLNNGVA